MTPDEIKTLVEKTIQDALQANGIVKPIKTPIDWNGWLISIGRIATPLLTAAVAAGVLWLQTIGKSNQTKLEEVHAQAVSNNEATESVAREVKASAKEIKKVTGTVAETIPDKK